MPVRFSGEIKTLMEYVGWKNVQSALRYVEEGNPFARTNRLLPITCIKLDTSERATGEETF